MPSPSNHVIVVGCGRVGAHVAAGLVALGRSVCVIDKNKAAFRRLGADFGGATVEGVGFDRSTLVEAGITPECAVAAVTSGDNSNVLIARVARETFGVGNVVARIYDPARASVYQRLGIPTVATVSWASERVLRRLVSPGAEGDWTDPSAAFTLAELRVPREGAGTTVAELERLAAVRIALLTRDGAARLAEPATLLQEDDLVHLVVATSQVDAVAGVFAADHTPGQHTQAHTQAHTQGGHR